MTHKEEVAQLEKLRERIDDVFTRLGVQPDDTLEGRNRLAFYGAKGSYGLLETFDAIAARLEALEKRSA